MKGIRQVMIAGGGLALGGILALAGCGGDGSGSGTTQSYAGAGSRWDVELASDNTFTITRRPTANAAVSMTASGSYQELASGFLKLTVSAASGTDAPNPGDAAYALNVPGYVFILKPLDPNSDQLIPMVKSGSCPSTNVSANWVMVKADSSADATDAGRDFYGTFAFDTGTQTASLPSRYNFNQTDLGSQALAAGSCSDGILTVSGADMFLTDGAGAIVHLGVDTPADDTDDQIVFGFARQSVGSVSALDGNYAGLLFDGGGTTGSKISPVAVSCSGGSCTGNIVTDVDNNTLSADSVTITLSTADNPGTGFVTGTIDDNQPGSSTGQLACMVNLDAQGSGKNIMSCAGQSPGSNSELFNILLVSK